MFLAIIAAGSVFASGWIGADTGITLMHSTSENQGVSVSATTLDYSFGITGAHYFNGSIGLGYSLGLVYPISAKVGDGSFSSVENAQLAFKPALSFQYQHDFNDTFSLEAGFGAYLVYDTDNAYGISQTTWQIGLEANVGVAFEIINHLDLKSGVKIPITVYSRTTVSGHGMNMSYSPDTFAIGVTPYVGLAYSY